MALLVQKFGGTCLGDVESLRRAAERIAVARRRGHDLVVIVSAMGHTTDGLIALAGDITAAPPPRELDMLVTAGERISAALLAMSLGNLGIPARSLTGSQAGLITDTHHGDAAIIDVVPQRVRKSLVAGEVVVVAGSQGVSRDGEVTTLGQGGSDTTAIALASALAADHCEIYTDVDGVYTADPALCPKAHKHGYISYDEMVEFTSQGARVLQIRAAELARARGVCIHVRSPIALQDGTWIGPHAHSDMGATHFTGIAHDPHKSRITIVGPSNPPGMATRLFRVMAEAHINPDMVREHNGSTDRSEVSFTVSRQWAKDVHKIVLAKLDAIGGHGVRLDPFVAKVSLVGKGISANRSVEARMVAALAGAGVEIKMLNSRARSICLLVKEQDVARTVRALHSAVFPEGLRDRERLDLEYLPAAEKAQIA